MNPKQLTPIKTATAIARIRAGEAELPREQRLFDDPYAGYFDDVHLDVQAVFDTIPFFREQIRLRTRYLDDCVREAVREGTRRVVLLGAGFDMRAARLPELRDAGAVVLELDHGEQLEMKKRRLTDEGIELPGHVRYVGADLMGDAEVLEDVLEVAGLDGDQPVLWVAEGLLGYLSLEAISTLGAVAARLSGHGSRMVGNYFVGALSLSSLVERLGPAGWSVEAGPTFEALYRRYIGSDVPAGSDAFAFMLARK